RRQLRRHDLHERKSSSALPRLAPRQQLWNDRLAARFPRLSLYLRPRRKIRHLLSARLSPMISRSGSFSATAAQRRAPLRNTETSPVPLSHTSRRPSRRNPILFCFLAKTRLARHLPFLGREVPHVSAQ